MLENEGHIQQNIEIDQISDDEIEADGQFETSEKTLNDFLNRPLESMAWTENIDKVFSSLSMRTFGQLLDYSTTTLGREPYLTEADLGLIHERLEQWRDETRALIEVETQNVTGSQQNVQSDGSEQAQVRDYPIDEFAWSVRRLVS